MHERAVIEYVERRRAERVADAHREQELRPLRAWYASIN